MEYNILTLKKIEYNNSKSALISFANFILFVLTLAISTNAKAAAIHNSEVKEVEYTILDAARKGDINEVIDRGVLRKRENIDKNIIDILYAANCDTETINNRYGETVLMRSIVGEYEYQQKLVKLIIDKGANINAEDCDGYTALMHAVDRNKKNIVQLLLDEGADYSKINKSGKTALDLAKIKGRVVLFDKKPAEIIKLLESEPTRRQAATDRRERLIAQLNNTKIPPVLVAIINAYWPSQLAEYTEAKENNAEK